MKYALYDNQGNIRKIYTQQEILKEMKLTHQQFANWIAKNTYDNNSMYHGYYLCELEIDDDPNYRLVCNGNRYKYYVSRYGKCCKICKNTERKTDIKRYKTQGIYYVTIHGKSVNLAKLMYEAFIGKQKAKTYAFKDDVIDLDHIILDVQRHKTNKTIGYYENGELKQVFYSTGAAGRALSITKQGVDYIVKNRPKNSSLDLRYI